MALLGASCLGLSAASAYASDEQRDEGSETGGESAGAPEDRAPPAAPRCDVKAQLLGVVYNDRDPERSFAMLSVGRNATRMVYVGSRVGGKRVGAIQPMAIWLGPVEDACWIPLDHEGPRTKVSPRKPKPKRKRKRK